MDKSVFLNIGLWAWVWLGNVAMGAVPQDKPIPQNQSQGGQLQSPTIPKIGDRLSDEQVVALARLALVGIDKEYPNKPSNVITGSEGVLSPRQLHPAFYGCFDWHSSVHGHWMLVRLLRLYPEMSIAAEVRSELDKHLTVELIRKEADYFLLDENRSFERMYGWAWALRLAAELEQSQDSQAQKWRAAIRPLEETLVKRIDDYLPKLQFPIRTGVHPDTAFALAQILDYAWVVNDTTLAELVKQRSRDYFLADRNYPFEYEPSGEDFLSSGLNEADLMRRVLPRDEFRQWLGGFMPNLQADSWSGGVKPVDVSDVTDPKIVHLAGLNLSRSWCLDGVAAALGADDPRHDRLRSSALEHSMAGYRYIFSGHYEGEHWLATFAIYSLTQAGIRP